MDKNNEIEDVREMDVKTDVTVVERAIEAAFYATQKGKRALALSESSRHKLTSAYAELDELRDRLKRAEDELERLGDLLNVIKRCADDETFSIVFGKGERYDKKDGTRGQHSDIHRLISKAIDEENRRS